MKPGRGLSSGIGRKVAPRASVLRREDRSRRTPDLEIPTMKSTFLIRTSCVISPTTCSSGPTRPCLCTFLAPCSSLSPCSSPYWRPCPCSTPCRGGPLIQPRDQPHSALHRRIRRSLCHDELLLVCYFGLGGMYVSLSPLPIFKLLSGCNVRPLPPTITVTPCRYELVIEDAVACSRKVEGILFFSI
jgi:hypothetical protein